MASPAATDHPPGAAGAPRAAAIPAAWPAGWRFAVALAGDALLLGSGLVIAIALRIGLSGWLGRFQWTLFALEQYGACVLIGLLLLAYEGVYAGGLAALNPTDRLVKALTGGLGATILYSFATQRSNEVSRFVLIAGYLVSLLFFTLARPLLRRRHGVAASLRLTAADHRTAALINGLQAAGLHVRGAEASAAADERSGVIVACLTADIPEARIAGWESQYGALGLIPSDREWTALGAEPVNLYGVQVFSIAHPLALRFNRGLKRGMDILGAAVLLLAAAPLGACIAALIRWESPGPCLFSQERLGQQGRPFRAWKFRSMHADADRRLVALLSDDPDRAAEFQRTFKLRQDPRVTRIGRLLRRTSLDELPQLWNVLRGDMSLVGPRPIVAAERELYGAAYAVVSTVRPGMTGIWQTSGRSEAAYDARKHFDVFYVRRWSAWLDIAILIRTLQAMVLPGDY